MAWVVALVAVASWMAVPTAPLVPVLQSGVAGAVIAFGEWAPLAGWSADLRESGLIACVGSGLIAVAAFVRRTM